MKHSPEPWSWTEDRPGCRDKNALVDANGEKVINPVSGWDRTNLGIKVKEVDARLIIAAPKLLALHKNDIDMLHAIRVLSVDSKDYGYISEEIEAMVKRKWDLIKEIENSTRSDKAG